MASAQTPEQQQQQPPPYSPPVGSTTSASGSNLLANGTKMVEVLQQFTTENLGVDKSKVDRLKDWHQTQMSRMRVWKEFFQFSTFSRPADSNVAWNRIMVNLNYYQSNYIVIFFLLIVYLLITNVALLIAAVILGGCYFLLSKRSPTDSLKILGREYSIQQIKVSLIPVALVLFWITSAGSTLGWLLMVSLIVILGHAMFKEGPPTETEIEMEFV